MKLVLVVVAAVLAVFSLMAFVAEVFPLSPETGLESLCHLVPCPTVQQVEPETGGVRIARLTRAVRHEPASPYAWCALGEAFADLGEPEKAAYSMRRAPELGAGIPSVLIRVATFYFNREEHEAALAVTAPVLGLVESHDEVVFGFYRDRDLPIPLILTLGLPADSRPRRSFFEHSLDWASAEDVRLIWESLVTDALTTDELAGSYIDYLVGRELFDRARETWATHLGERAGEYPHSNFLFNGGFEQQPTRTILDWMIDDIDGVQAERVPEALTGRYALELNFSGTHNVDYRHTFQVACLPPGKYMFSAWVRSADITTDQGPYFRIRGSGSPTQIDFQTPQWKGTRDWTEVKAVFTISAVTTPILVEIRRDSSLKFDSKIAGLFWTDDVTLENISSH